MVPSKATKVCVPDVFMRMAARVEVAFAQWVGAISKASSAR
jgi:hypothetical protein